MKSLCIKMLDWISRKFGYKLVRMGSHVINDRYTDVQDSDLFIINKVKNFTMTSPERIISLLNSIEHIVKNQISGDIVECGVWRGGSMMASALKLQDLGDVSRILYLYDTFEGMTVPTDKDIHANGKSAISIYNEIGQWCYADIEDVKRNIKETNYPESQVRFVKGKVEETIPSVLPEKIAFLRLDTDWYESTMHELKNLFPRLVSGGILIIDDYGHWSGAKRAVDEYFDNSNQHFLHRIDYTGRLVVKK